MIYKLKRTFDKFVDYVAILILIVLTYVCFHQVVARYVFSSPPAWTEETARYLFVWVSMIGSAIAFRTASHLGVDFLVKLFPVKARKIVSLLVNIVTIIVLVITFFAGLEVVADVNNQLSPAMRLPMSYAYLAIPVGILLMILEATWSLFNGSQNSEVRL